MTTLSDPIARRFADDGSIPNNPKLPALIYAQALGIGGDDDGAAAMERLFARNSWPPQWRSGIYPFHHYHSTAHEVLGIARGRVRLRLGGESGEDFDLQAGDVAVLTAGPGHKRLTDRGNLLVVGGYPPGQDWDLLRGDASERPGSLENIAAVALPATDPVYGKAGPLLSLWKS